MTFVGKVAKAYDSVSHYSILIAVRHLGTLPPKSDQIPDKFVQQLQSLYENRERNQRGNSGR